MSTPGTSNLLDRSASTSVCLDPSEVASLQAAIPKTKRGANRRPLHPNDLAAAAKKEAEVKVVSKEAISSLHASYMMKNFEVLKNISAKLKILQTTPIVDLKTHQNLLNMAYDFDTFAEQFKTLLTLERESGTSNLDEKERNSQIVKILHSSKYGVVSESEQDAIDAEIQKLTGGTITQVELNQKYLHFLRVIDRLKQFRANLSMIQVELANNNHVLTATNINQIDLGRLKSTVESLLKQRKDLDAEATALDSIIPLAYKRLNDLVARFAKVYGDPQIPETDSLFVRAGGMSYKTQAESYKIYERMFDRVQRLKGQIQSLDSLWTQTTNDWDKTKDELRGLSYVNTESALVSWYKCKTHDGYGVKSFHFGPISAKMPPGFFTGWIVWGLGTSENKDGAGPSKSSS